LKRFNSQLDSSDFALHVQVASKDSTSKAQNKADDTTPSKQTFMISFEDDLNSLDC